MLVTHAGDPAGYHGGAAYVKAAGLNPAGRSSGTCHGRLKISNRGSSTVRFWTYLAALRLIRKGSPARPWYPGQNAPRQPRGPGRRRVAIVRRLGRALYDAAARGAAFGPKRLFPGQILGIGPVSNESRVACGYWRRD